MFQSILQYRGARLQNVVVRWLGGRSGNIVPKPFEMEFGFKQVTVCSTHYPKNQSAPPSTRAPVTSSAETPSTRSAGSVRPSSSDSTAYLRCTPSPDRSETSQR